MGIRNFAHNHPIITGAIAGSVLPGIGTITGALIGLGYAVVTEKELKRGHLPSPWWERKDVRLMAILVAIIVWICFWVWWAFYQ